MRFDLKNCEYKIETKKTFKWLVGVFKISRLIILFMIFERNIHIIFTKYILQ